jgi:hypothetical protein
MALDVLVAVAFVEVRVPGAGVNAGSGAVAGHATETRRLKLFETLYVAGSSVEGVALAA